MMKEIKRIIELLEMNMQAMSQIPSVYQRTEEALKTAKVVNHKLDAIHALIETKKYANDVITVHQIQIILEA